MARRWGLLASEYGGLRSSGSPRACCGPTWAAWPTRLRDPSPARSRAGRLVRLGLPSPEVIASDPMTGLDRTRLLASGRRENRTRIRRQRTFAQLTALLVMHIAEAPALL